MSGSLSLSGLGAHGAEFLRWWRRELRDMVPRRLRLARPRLVLDLRDGAPRIARAAGQRLQPVAPFPGGGEAAGKGRALRGLAAQDEVVLVVPPAWILRRVLQLPAAAEPRLKAVLNFEIEQHVPFAPEEMVWDARILRRLPEAQRVEVEVAVMPRFLLAPVAAGLRRVARTARLVARPDPAEEWPSVPLDALAPPQTRWRRRIEAGLGVAALLLALQFGQAELRRQEEMTLALEARAAQARRQAESVLALEAGVAALRTRLAAAAALRGGRPASLVIIEEVAQRLPDDVWLTELRLTGDQLLLSGFAARSDALLEQLDGSGILRDVRFAAPVTRGQRDTTDRFQVALRVVPPPEAQRPAARLVQR
ncbi:PilN domain-containing protein [Roseomonas sp. SSH11]|uniref:PilN domain-containing protein n=1 Tax=Pararoseomonas baculiformis TaxID=2820812 RepID=A0ABS4AC05_9PROT|nr:PilN domain-containing protein [Pararoseomonas baculiformis]MBP0444545.1 PilN domain-containing protein [Pararoseomonas baculiformis]